MPFPSAPAVNLDNCDREPIHIPGLIQGHGALLAFDAAGEAVWASTNASALLGEPAGVRDAIALHLAEADPATPRQHEVALGGTVFDLLVHRSGDLAVAEFEPRDPAADPSFMLKAHRAIDRLRRRRTLQELLEAAVAEVRDLTGFDRVMAYRFRHDASGDVVAEARAETLEPFLNRRYPASDIPAQARRLYVVNTLRLIADVKAAPVGLTGHGAVPLDMSHCVLRSVSPIHIEYLNNMGVGASMSVSIVIGGQLWGMIACHHMTPRHVAPPVRMACDVLAQVLAANVQTLLAAERAERMTAASALRSRLVVQLVNAEDSLAVFPPLAAELEQLMGAGASFYADGSQVAAHGVEPATARELLHWLQEQAATLDGGILARDSLVDLPAALAAGVGAWCGFLALRYDGIAGGWMVFLRHEQVETVDWGGRPEKEYVNGPLGPRLTPRGSFEVWRETVRGTSVPWGATDLEIARHLLDELSRVTGARHAELGQAKNQMLAVLGHDLRNPLQTISMSAHVLERGADGVKMGQRIQSASGRMQRLISQVLDMSRLQSGLGLGFSFQTVDVAALVNGLVEDFVLAHPEMKFVNSIEAPLEAQADADRLSQLAGNLLANARHHGEPGQPVRVTLRREGADVVLEVANRARPVPDDAASQLFTPYKRQSVQNPHNKGGLGLGLYIAREIAKGHGGSLEYAWRAPEVVFTARFPAAPARP